MDDDGDFSNTQVLSGSGLGLTLVLSANTVSIPGMTHAVFLVNGSKHFTIAVSSSWMSAEKLSNSTLRTYPNPLAENLALEAERPLSAKDVWDYNSLSQEVSSKMSIDQNGQKLLVLSFIDLPAGIYFIRANGETLKVIKE